MIRKFVLAASAAALAAGGLGLATAGSATAGVTVIAGAGSSVSCNVTGTAKVKPSLADNYIAADHASDPDPHVVALPNTTYAPPAPEGVSVKGASSSCTGTATDGTNTTTITKVSIMVVNDPAHPSSTSGTCVGLARQGLGLDPPSTTRYIETIKYTATPFKVAPTTITDNELQVPAAGLNLVNGTITGSFAGGTSTTDGTVDGTLTSGTTGIFTQELFGPAPDGTTVATSTSPNAPNVCQPGLKIKPGVSATIKKPKGLKAIGLVTGSTFTASR